MDSIYASVVSTGDGSITLRPAPPVGSAASLSRPKPPRAHSESPNGGNYTVNGIDQSPTLRLVQGQTYTFQNDSHDSHPLLIQESTDAGTTFATVSEDSDTFNFIAPSFNSSLKYKYQCGNHSGMNGVIEVVESAETLTGASLDGSTLSTSLTTSFGSIPDNLLLSFVTKTTASFEIPIPTSRASLRRSSQLSPKANSPELPLMAFLSTHQTQVTKPSSSTQLGGLRMGMTRFLDSP